MAKKLKHLDLPALLTVSKNILKTAHNFDAFDMNITVIITHLLRDYVYYSEDPPVTGEIFLRYSTFSGRHVKREELVERINKLCKKNIQYPIDKQGANAQVISGLFSDVVVTSGGVSVKLTQEVIPWLLHIGPGVGYGYVEPELFLNMSSVYYKRLYFFLCAKLINGKASFTITREELYKAAGFPEGVLLHDVISRYLYGLMNYLKDNRSRYQMFFKPSTSPASGVGRPSIVSFNIDFFDSHIRPQANGPDVKCLNLLRKLVPVLQKKYTNLMPFPVIHSRLVEGGTEQKFYDAMIAYFNYKDDHQANIMVKVLKDRCNIDIFQAYPIKKQNGKA